MIGETAFEQQKLVAGVSNSPCDVHGVSKLRAKLVLTYLAQGSLRKLVTQEVTIREKKHCRELNLGYHLLGMPVPGGWLSEKSRETWSERFSRFVVAVARTALFPGASVFVQFQATGHSQNKHCYSFWELLKKVDAWYQLRTFSPTFWPRTTLKPAFSSSWAKTYSKKQKSGLFGAVFAIKSHACMQMSFSHAWFLWPVDGPLKWNEVENECISTLSRSRLLLKPVFSGFWQETDSKKQGGQTIWRLFSHEIHCWKKKVPIQPIIVRLFTKRTFKREVLYKKKKAFRNNLTTRFLAKISPLMWNAKYGF